MSANSEIGVVVMNNIYAVYFNFAGGDYEINVFSGEFIGALAVNFDSGVFGRSLGYFADERLEGLFDIELGGDGWLWFLFCLTVGAG